MVCIVYVRKVLIMKQLATLALIFGLAGASDADIALPKVIGNKMVIQRGVEAPIWGWASPGEQVTVTFAGQVKTALPDAKGKWMIKLDPMEASTASRAMTFKGNNEITLEDVLVGEVWLASGQSNMEWTFAQIAPEEAAFAAAQSSNSLVRAFHVNQHITAGVPLDDTLGQWKHCAEMVAPARNVSAVGFFFALKLQQALGVPVAILDANWGGQRIESFIPDGGYKALGLPFRKHGGNQNPNGFAEQLKDIAASVDAAVQAAENGRKIPFLFGDRVHGWAENGIYNAMIAPLAPFAIKGAIWYQGEANRGAIDYFKKLRALSAGWSTEFNVPNIPLYQVQIAPFAYNAGKEDDATLCDSVWAAQYRGAEEILGMGVVAIHDTHINVRDIHPRHKRTVGERLAAQALKNQYGKDVVSTGPRVADATLEGSKAIVSFRGVDQGLGTTDGQAPSWFELSADGKTFVPAEAMISGNTVEVRASTVPTPTYVRMGWYDIAIPNLKDKNGWPVFAFPAQPVLAGEADPL